MIENQLDGDLPPITAYDANCVTCTFLPFTLFMFANCLCILGLSYHHFCGSALNDGAYYNPE